LYAVKCYFFENHSPGKQLDKDNLEKPIPQSDQTSRNATLSNFNPQSINAPITVPQTTLTHTHPGPCSASDIVLSKELNLLRRNNLGVHDNDIMVSFHL
jgi:hypothetical protein